MTEEFRELTYKNNKFQVGNMGTIMRDKKIISTHLDSCGYELISLKVNNSWTTVGVHRLVALAWVDNIDINTRTEVNHIDYNRRNNIYTNLEWVTHHENVLHSKQHYKHYGSDNPNYGNHKLSEVYANNPEYAKEKQGRKDLQNGRCRKITLFYDGQKVADFECIKFCCQYLQTHYNINRSCESMRSAVDSCVRNNKTYYQHFTFQKF